MDFSSGCGSGQVSLAARRSMLREHDAVVFGFGDAPMRDQTAGHQVESRSCPAPAFHMADDPGNPPIPPNHA
jgi:hypothetical protein